jgi:hypothetical protein
MLVHSRRQSVVLRILWSVLEDQRTKLRWLAGLKKAGTLGKTLILVGQYSSKLR